ncbi:hypothetical protein MF271_21405 (plasmid) [Deinococcus sp. KNUC1210]|uniref:hypothetical protein n=1 Tax=Deinococcus sp. KNUC1210 TaxID=2917691 RepID=UPI001EF0C229|nr:hypothetical protein [Deinococcus sp. KNUC1210]ULH17607.1 hypothetical protein MF271_21405 [Deinococcus sp. KNUC1210]
MSPFRPPKQHLPDHLKHLRTSAAPRKVKGSALEDSPRAAQQAAEEPATPRGSERLGHLLPLVLRAMVGDRSGDSAGRRPVLITQSEILAALAPYHRPRSRFEGLIVRKLVGEGYLRPRGARDKSGLSDAYELTPKGEDLLDIRHSR